MEKMNEKQQRTEVEQSIALPQIHETLQRKEDELQRFNEQKRKRESRQQSEGFCRSS